MQWFVKATRHIDTVGIWAGLWGLLSTAYSWLASRLTAFHDLAWPEIVAIGIGAALLTMLAVTASLAMWRSVRPLPPAPESCSDVRQPVPIPTTAPAAPTCFEPGSLYVGSMRVTAENVGEHGMIEILALCLNATGHVLDLQRIEGQVKLTEFKDGKQIEVGKLPRPWFSSTTGPTRNIPNLMEFMVVLEQPVPPEIGSRFRELQGKQGLSLELNELQVFVSLHEAPQQAIRLPLWDGIMVRRAGEDLQSSRVLFLTGALVEG